MTEINQVWKCEICGNIIEVVHTGADALVCCGQPMKLQTEHGKEGEKQEKHVPIVEITSSGVNVRIGSVEHPMTEEHYIEWVEVLIDGKTYRRFLKPGEKPEADFSVTAEEEKKIIARCYCNLHGLWTT